MKNLGETKVAIVYDRVNTPYGGAENVLLAIKEIFPDAPIFTSVYDCENAKWARDIDIKSSFLQSIPRAKKQHRLMAPLMPLAFESLDLSSFDIVLSITSAEAIGVITQPHQLHVCYLLTPPRYLFSHRKFYQQHESSLSSSILKPITNFFLNYLTRWHKIASNRPDVIIPISELVKQRTKKYYNRKTNDVVYPPINIPTKQELTNFSPSFSLPNNFLLVVSRLLHYKQINLAIEACQELKQNLVIVGEGPEEKNLKRLAKNGDSSSEIIFLGSQPYENIQYLFKQTSCLLMPGIEDFGITALEANSYGKPAIISKESGVAEIIKNKKHGLHLKDQTTEAMIEAISLLNKSQFETKPLFQNAAKYDTNVFINRLKTDIIEVWKQLNKD